MTTQQTLKLAADYVTPLQAYAALRSFAPERSSFLLESVVPGEHRGRYSIVGYRIQQESVYPPGGDAISLLANAFMPSDASPQGLAERFAQAFVGFITHDASHKKLTIPPWENEGVLARLMQGATVAVFDHLEHTVTVAGPSNASVNRCTWEMTHGPGMRLLRAPNPANEPEYVDASMDDATYIARVRRAQEHISAGELKEIVLARTFRTPIRGADPIDIYRALRVLSPSPYFYFLDFAETPMMPSLIILGASREAVSVASEGSAQASETLRTAFPLEALTGAPRERATQLIRELEGGPRGVFGGAVGYVLPDGSLDLAIALRTLVIQGGEIEITSGARITAQSAPEREAEVTREKARAALAAIRAAQDAAVEREQADAAKRAKEEAKAKAAEGGEKE